MSRVYIETYGCQMNVADSEVVFSILAAKGYERTEKIEDADVIMANTCSVRDNAEQKILRRIEYFDSFRRRRGALVGILGCMAERIKDALLDTGKVDFVAGPDAYRSIPDLLEAAKGGGKAINVELSRSETYEDIIPVRLDTNGVSAFISIMRGCNNVCSYCVVPYTRGRERSRSASTVVREACDCFAKGYREVTLLGQNVDSYLWKAEDGTEVDFASLVEMVAKISPLLRVRFATSNPQDLSDALLAVMASNENVCRHIHLPVQSGSNRILEKMRRRYTREWYLQRVEKIRSVLPDCGLTTDVIAGFCSETPEDHALTLDLFERVGFDSAFMFAYSERPGTIAARNYPDDVPVAEKTRRLEEIIALQGRKSLERYRADIGKTFRVLVEGPSKKDPGQLCGRASNNKMCVWSDSLHKAGDYVDVKVDDCTSATLKCSLL